MESHFLENNTLESICDQIFQSVEKVIDCPVEARAVCSKLKSYRMVSRWENLHVGKHVRWLKILAGSKHILHAGGIVVNVRCSDQGIYVMVLNKYANRVMQYKWKDNVTFQKLTEDEMIVLLAKGIKGTYGSL